jgi:hypothetical protein
MPPGSGTAIRGTRQWINTPCPVRPRGTSVPHRYGIHDVILSERRQQGGDRSNLSRNRGRDCRRPHRCTPPMRDNPTRPGRDTASASRDVTNSAGHGTRVTTGKGGHRHHQAAALRCPNVRGPQGLPAAYNVDGRAGPQPAGPAIDSVRFAVAAATGRPNTIVHRVFPLPLATA